MLCMNKQHFDQIGCAMQATLVLLDAPDHADDDNFDFLTLGFVDCRKTKSLRQFAFRKIVTRSGNDKVAISRLISAIISRIHNVPIVG